MERVQKLIDKCGGMFSIKVDGHKKAGQSVSDHVMQANVFSDNLINDIGVNVYNKMLELDTVVFLVFWVGGNTKSYQVIHYDVEQAVDEALALLEEKPYVAKDKKLLGNYILLDIKNDQAAKKAAKCYAMAIKDDNPTLSIKIIKQLE